MKDTNPPILKGVGGKNVLLIPYFKDKACENYNLCLLAKAAFSKPILPAVLIGKRKHNILVSLICPFQSRVLLVSSFKPCMLT